jgi:hypothetical protein
MSRILSFLAVRSAICRVGTNGIGLYVKEKELDLVCFSHAELKKRSGSDVIFSNDQKLDWSRSYSVAIPSCKITVAVVRINQPIFVKPFPISKTRVINSQEPIFCISFDNNKNLQMHAAESLEHLEQECEKYEHIQVGSLIFNSNWNEFFGIRI